MRFYIIAGYLFTAVFGTLSHFLYDCSGQNLFIALFAPVNESIWEHMKLSFFPVLLYAFFLSYIRQPEKEFHTLRDALLLGNFVGTFSIPVRNIGTSSPCRRYRRLSARSFLCFPIRMERKGYGPDRQPAKMDLSIDCASGSFIFHLYLLSSPDRIVSGFKLNNVHFF